MQRLSRVKHVVREPSRSSELQAAITEFQQKLRDRMPGVTGAIFFAVCRGKVSEGLDFANEIGRAVIVTGLPYPNSMDPKVKLKQEYLDESTRKEKTALTGEGERGERQREQRGERACAIGNIILHTEERERDGRIRKTAVGDWELANWTGKQ